jgi:Ca2+-binding RTX toxin-like protein
MVGAGGEHRVSVETSPDIQGHARLCGCAACRAGTTASAPEPQDSVIMTSAGGGSMSFLTDPYYVTSLLPSDEYRWNYNAPGTGLTLTYGFMTTMPWYAQWSGGNNPNWFGNEWGTFVPFTAAQRAAVDRAIQNYEDVCNVDFVYQANGDSATVRFGSAAMYPDEAAHAYYPQRSENGDWEGDVWFNHSVSDTVTQTPGSYGYFVTLHEIGHTLGLKHPHDWQQGGTTLPYMEDNRQYTVMSYQGHPNYGIEPSSLLLYDIAALQYLYGANMATRSGDTTYTWAANEQFISCIWDGGGIDTIDASNQSRRVVIDLNPGNFSSVGSRSGSNATNNLSIAFESWIENAIGGSGSDTLIGNGAANRLEGGAGDDTLKGGGGGDTYVGGDGFDTVSYQGANWWEGAGDLLINLATGIHGGAATGDHFVGVEAIVGGPGFDTLIGDAGDNWLYGGGAVNVLKGGGGADYLDGGFSTGDRVSYDTSPAGVNVNLATGIGRGGDAEGDVLVNFEDIDGSSFDDVLVGNAAPNLIRGGAGNDYMDGGAGFDTFGGGAGDDIYIVEAGENVYEDDGNGFDEVRTTANFWLLSPFVEKLVFIGTGSFEGRGQNLDEILVGGAGDDRLTGNGGNDTIDGGDGVDVAVYLGNRADYQIVRAAGQLTIADQRVGHSTDGVDTLFGVERLEFADGVIVANSAPVAVTANLQPAHGVASLAASSLFSISDQDGDSITLYQFRDDTTGNGYFRVGGAAQGSTFQIAANQLPTTQFVVGTQPGTSDRLQVRAFDGFSWGVWQSFTVSSQPNAAPVVNVRNFTPAHNDVSLAAADLWTSITDADGDAMTQYRFYDGTLGNGRLWLDGTALAEKQALDPIDAADLAGLSFATSAAGSDLLWVQAYDGYEWSAWKSFTVNAVPNAAPVVNVRTISPGRNDVSITGADLWASITDADGDVMTQYWFYDGTVGNGRLRLNGVDLAERTPLTPISAADLANLEFITSADGPSLLWVQAYDGMTWSEWKSFTVNAVRNAAPVVNVRTISPGRNDASIAGADLWASITDADGDAMMQYWFYDGTVGNGRLRLNGVDLAERTPLTPIDASDLANLEFITSADGPSLLWVQAYDGMTWSEWKSFTVNAVRNAAPTLASISQSAPRNTTLAVTDLFTPAQDPDGDPIILYRFWDSTATAGSGSFKVDGEIKSAKTAVDVMASQLASAEFVTGSAPGTDLLWVTAYDGVSWSESKSLQLTTLAST